MPAPPPESEPAMLSTRGTAGPSAAGEDEGGVEGEGAMPRLYPEGAPAVTARRPSDLPPRSVTSPPGRRADP